MVKVTQIPDDQRSYVIPGYTSHKCGEGQDVIPTKSHTDKSLASSSHLYILFSPKYIDLLLTEPNASLCKLLHYVIGWRNSLSSA